MSDYMFMLENHLSPDQNRVVAEVQDAAADAGVNLFLTGGAMRDMLGGFPIRDLDFTVEGNALKVVKTLTTKGSAKLISTDEDRKKAELRFPGGVTAEVAMARHETYGKPGARPKVQPASIHEDLRGRDFTMNAIALSLNRASRGLLLDPNNGSADIERKELRAISSYSFYDDPPRLLRLIRFKIRLGFAIDERTQLQYANAREAGMEAYIPPQALLAELWHIADEPDAGELVRALDEQKLLALFSPALVGPKLNLAGLSKLHKAKQMIPFGLDLHLDNRGLVLWFLAEKLTAKEKAALIQTTTMQRADVDFWQKLDQRAKKLEKELKSARLHKASQVYQVLSKAPGDQILFLYICSAQRLVQDRIRNFLQKYALTAMEVTDREVAATGVTPGTPKFLKAKEEMIAGRVDGRIKKAPPPEPLPPPVPTGPQRGPRGR